MDGDFVTPNDLVGVVDAFTGEALDAALGLYQCSNCKVYYHRASFEVIKTENGGKCVAFPCQSISIRVVSLSQRRPESRATEPKKPRKTSSAFNYAPDAVTLFNYREHLDRVVTFQGLVRKVLVSRRGTDFALMFENLDWTAGFKVVVFKKHLRAVGDPSFLRGLNGKTIRVRGLVQFHRTFGFEIIVSERSMIQEIQ